MHYLIYKPLYVAKNQQNAPPPVVFVGCLERLPNLTHNYLIYKSLYVALKQQNQDKNHWEVTCVHPCVCTGRSHALTHICTVLSVKHCIWPKICKIRTEINEAWRLFTHAFYYFKDSLAMLKPQTQFHWHLTRNAFCTMSQNITFWDKSKRKRVKERNKKKLIIAALGKHMTLQIFLAITNPLSFHYLLYLLNERGTRAGSVFFVLRPCE